MIRERRSKEKLQQYYQKFVERGIIDPNVHPWVAESWLRSKEWGIARDSLRPAVKLTKEELEERRSQHQPIIDFLEGLYQEIRGHLNMYNLSLLLLDGECYALKCYALPFFQKSPIEVEGARLTEVDIGTSSIALAYQHMTPFFMFGPEFWIEDGQSGDACTAPVFLDGKLTYLITLVSTEQGELPYGALETMVLMLKHALEQHLTVLASLEARQVMLDAIPMATYHVLPGGQVAYANRLGLARLHPEEGQNRLPDLDEVVLNYPHTPIYKGFLGIPSHNKEVTWITPQKTYEDITTVLPLYREGEVSGVVAISLSIEDLKMLEAHATGYSARYSLASMVGYAPAFMAMKERAGRAARNDHHLLLQGEAGTGKERLAHGIHQASSRAAGPLITLRCGAFSPEALADEIFGVEDNAGERVPGKLALANEGTLFLDEIEKLPYELGQRLAVVLSGQAWRDGARQKADVRLIVACDGDLKRQAEKGKFPSELYELVAKPTIRVPALRARREDIELVARHIIQELAGHHNMSPKEISPAAQVMLSEYDWPGNIKQLQAVVEQAFFRSTGDSIQPGDIHLPGETGPGDAWKEDRAAFIAAWQAARGNISRLSGMLGVSRVTLYRYLKKYGLEKE